MFDTKSRDGMSNKQFGLIDNWLRNIKDTYSANEERLEALDEPERTDVLVELNVAKSHCPECVGSWVNT
ncbi:UNVERIFIED_CONTAM: hypothetical protein HDU68_012215 [Siphonaria sp. JEL0065]|nr:hypothetical protein HDU68_012215 [Siphonaria sp. JEL0065]